GAQQRAVDAVVLVEAAGGRVAGAALNRHDRRLLRGMARGQPVEGDSDPRPVRPARIQRPLDRAAPAVLPAAAAVQRDAAELLRGRARGCGKEREQDQGQNRSPDHRARSISVLEYALTGIYRSGYM